MPTYHFYNKKTKKKHKDFMSISEMEEYTKNNPDVELLINGAPMIGTRIMVNKKPDDGFRDILRKIKKDHRGSTINTF